MSADSFERKARKIADPYQVEWGAGYEELVQRIASAFRSTHPSVYPIVQDIAAEEHAKIAREAEIRALSWGVLRAVEAANYDPLPIRRRLAELQKGTQ